MARFDKKPFIILTCNFERPFTLFDDNKPRRLHSTATIMFPTYREFLKKLKKVSIGSGNWTVTLIRYKRGEWGEWFERWVCNDGILSIEREGWM